MRECGQELFVKKLMIGKNIKPSNKSSKMFLKQKKWMALGG